MKRLPLPHFRCGLIVVSFLLAAGPAGAGEPPPLRDIKATCDAEPQTIREVSRLFQTGPERVDRDAMKAMVLAVVDSYDSDQPYDNQENGYYDALRRLFDHADTRRLDVADVLSIREWLASSYEVTDNDKGPWDLLAGRVDSALRDVWKLAQDPRNQCIACEPRHALLCVVLTDTRGPLGQLTRLVRLIDNESPKERVRKYRDEQLVSPIVTFLWAPEHKNLLTAAREDIVIGDLACTGNEPFAADDLVQKMLDDRKDQRAVRRHLDAFMPQYEVALKVFPAHYLSYKHGDIQRLRAAWNIVHGYGDDDTKEAVKAFVESLRDYHAERGETLAAKWLNQVMKPPAKPVERYLHTVILTPVEEPEDTKK